MKARSVAEVRKFTDIPNVGPAMSADFKLLGITTPAELQTQDGYALYEKLCRVTGVRQDPCVLDTFLAVVDFMRGAPPHPWWHYTPERKGRFPGM